MLTRSVVAGILVLAALPTLVEPMAAALLRRAGATWTVRAEQALPYQYGLDRLYGTAGGAGTTGVPGRPSGLAGSLTSAFEATEPIAAAALLAPAALLLVACLLIQARRRSF